MATIHASRPRPIPPPRGSGIPHTAPNDLPRLMKWLYAVDREFLADALWLRFDRLTRQAHYTHQVLQISSDDRLLFPTPTLPAVHSEPLQHVYVSSGTPRCDVKDHLTVLPYHVRLNILEFLLKPLPVLPLEQTKDDEADEESYDWMNYVLPRLRPPHPLNQLAATSKAWRDQVEAFCGHQLLVLKQQIALGRQDDWVSWRRLRTFTNCARMELVVRVSECCAFCGRETITQSKKWYGNEGCNST